MSKQIITLLDEIIRLSDHAKAARSQKADRFNLFGILNITSDEVRLHSKFLAELLNPGGSHDQGTLFLEKFLELTNCNQVFEDLSKVRVHVEYVIGPKTALSGGRIDLLLADDKRCAIIIENKIFASDQDNQLLRYHHYGEQLRTNGASYRLLYLTLDGRAASDRANGATLTDDQYIAIAYSFHIKKWLETCRQSLTHLPKLAIALDHYLQLIDQLTGITMDRELQQAIIGRMTTTGETFAAASAIASMIPEAKAAIFQQFGERLETTLRERLKVDTARWEQFGTKWKGMEIFHGAAGDPQNRNPHIRLSFSSDYNDCYIELHPGLLHNLARSKNTLRVSRYADLLADHFATPLTKVIAVNKWEGEWVCRYGKLDNAWQALIDQPDRLLEEVVTDLQVVFVQLVKVLAEAELHKTLPGQPEALADFSLRYQSLMQEMALQMNDPENDREIIGDGVHTPEAYFANPVRIAWMLKEPYDDVDGKGGGWNLYDMFNDKDQYTRFSGGHRATWHPITYATYALKNGFLKWSDMDYVRDDHDMFEVLKSTAFINAQKLPARNMTTTDFADLHESLEKHNDLLLQQIELLRPNVLIFANTLHVYSKYLGLSKHPLQQHGTLNYIFHEGKLYIDAYHPAQRTVKGVLYNDDIVEVVKKFEGMLN